MSDGINATESFVEASKGSSSFVGKRWLNLTERRFGLEGLNEHIAKDYIVPLLK